MVTVRTAGIIATATTVIPAATGTIMTVRIVGIIAITVFRITGMAIAAVKAMTPAATGIMITRDIGIRIVTARTIRATVTVITEIPAAIMTVRIPAAIIGRRSVRMTIWMTGMKVRISSLRV